MRYNVFHVAGSSTKRFKEEPYYGVSDTAETIRETYDSVAKEGGRIIAGHSLRVDEAIEGSDRPMPAEVLFLVAEYADNHVRQEPPIQ